MNSIKQNDPGLAALLCLDTPTPLLDLPALARMARVDRVLVKVEAARPLGNFKALGGAVAAIRSLCRALGVPTLASLHAAGASGRTLPTLLCASDGNHGLAVAAAARAAGTGALVYLPRHASAFRAHRIEAMGATILRVEGTYDDAVAEAAAAASGGAGLLIPDTSQDPDDIVVHDVMMGYAIIADEIAAQLSASAMAAPSHLFVQAGAAGLADLLHAASHDAMRARLRLDTDSRVLLLATEGAAHAEPSSLGRV